METSNRPKTVKTLCISSARLRLLHRVFYIITGKATYPAIAEEEAIDLDTEPFLKMVSGCSKLLTVCTVSWIMLCTKSAGKYYCTWTLQKTFVTLIF